MLFGPVAQGGLPYQDPQRLLLLAERYNYAYGPHQKWAELARRCVDMCEGRQWTETELAHFRRTRRPALVFNKIARYVRLIMGYQRNNRTDTRFLPGHDGTGSDDIAEAISHVWKQITTLNDVPQLDSETFLDGIIGGRGIQDMRLDFSSNDFGDVTMRTGDPFANMIDPDLDGYDLEAANFLIDTRWTSLDEIDAHYGPEAAELITPLVRGSGPAGPILSLTNQIGAEISPPRRFAMETDEFPEWWRFYSSHLMDTVDRQRKSLKILDFQYKSTTNVRTFIDLDTGDRKMVPDHWTPDDVQKALYFAQMRKQPMTVQVRPQKRVRWTTIVGDLMVYDAWSPYECYTKVGYFPWFRRGMTRGMVEDLIDPQVEINKRRSSQIEIVSRTANTGWIIHEDTLSPQMEKNLGMFGAQPGIVIKWRGGKNTTNSEQIKPTKIEPSPPPTAMEKLEQAAVNDMQEISGINESALGEIDKVQSGRAIEARQRQAVIAAQVYMDNFSRFKRLVAKKGLYMIQNFYTEPRMVRTLGDNGLSTLMPINKGMLDPVTGLWIKINDVTLGKYSLVLDEIPLSASFANAQFEEALTIIEKLAGALPPQAIADILVDLSTLPRKAEIKKRLVMLGLAPPDTAGGMPGAMPAGPPPGAAPPQPGAPPPGQPPAPNSGARGGPRLTSSGGAPSFTSANGPGGTVVPIRPSGGPQPRVTQ